MWYVFLAYRAKSAYLIMQYILPYVLTAYFESIAVKLHVNWCSHKQRSPLFTNVLTRIAIILFVERHK